jgi:membrane-bound ClpP family serine protease
MMNILSKLSSGLHSITPHMNEATSGIINKLGIASVVTGGTSALTSTAIVSRDPTWMTVSNAVAILSIVGSTMFIIKLAVDIYFARKKDKREEAEQKRKDLL